MSINLTTPLTGSAQTGFTSPTYTLAVDNAPSIYGKQWYVSGIGGTQTGVGVHTIASPFTIAFFRPAQPQMLPTPNPTTGVISYVPMNVYKLVVRKGTNSALNLPSQELIRCEIRVPAGADTYDAANLRAGLSAAIGALWQLSPGIGDTIVTGTI